MQAMMQSKACSLTRLVLTTWTKVCTEQDAVKVKFVVFSAGLNVNMLWNSRELESIVIVPYR